MARALWLGLAPVCLFPFLINTVRWGHCDLTWPLLTATLHPCYDQVTCVFARLTLVSPKIQQTDDNFSALLREVFMGLPPNWEGEQAKGCHFFIILLPYNHDIRQNSGFMRVQPAIPFALEDWFGAERLIGQFGKTITQNFVSE